MNKLQLTLLSVLMAATATAQINKGAWLISASTSFGFNSYNTNGGSSASLVNLGTKAGYFVGNNFALGLNFNFLSVSEQGTNVTYTVIGPFARYYVGGKFFFGAGFSAATQSSSYSGVYTGSNSVSSVVIPIEFGYAAFITKNLAIEPSINYVKADDEKGGLTINGFPVGGNSSIGLNIALTLYLHRTN